MYEYIYIYISQTITAFFSQALDYLAIGVHELANMSERRIERLVNPGKKEVIFGFSGVCQFLVSIGT